MIELALIRSLMHKDFYDDHKGSKCPDRLFSNDYVDLTSLGSYVVNPDFVYTGTLDSANTIKAFVTQGTSTQGAATVTINYS